MERSVKETNIAALKSDLAKASSLVLADFRGINVKNDTALRRDAYGAIVRVALSGGRILTRSVHTDGSYLSARDGRVHFGLGPSPDVERVLVVWPKGRAEAKLSFPQEWVRHHDSYKPAIVGARLKPPSR